MDSETTVADESDLMSVISETTVGSINSPVMFNLLSRFKEPVIADSLDRNLEASPSIPDQNFDLSNLECDLYKEAVGNLPSENDDENSQSLLSERYGSSDIRRTKYEEISRGKLSALEFNHSSQLRTDYRPKEAMMNINERVKYVDDDLNACSNRENIHDSAANNQCIDDMHKAVQETLSHILTSLERMTPDLDPPISCLKTRVTPMSPFTGFDSEIYPESMPATTVDYRKNISTHESTEDNCLDILDIENTKRAVQDYNTKSVIYDDEVEILEDLLATAASKKYVNMKRNTLICSSDVQYIGLNDETQAPVSDYQSPELNLPTIRPCPTESGDEQSSKKPPFSENCQQHTTDMLRVKDIQVSSPQLSVVSDQSTEICRLDFRAETIDIAYSQSNDIPLDSKSPRVTYEGDADTTKHCSNRFSIETERFNVQKASLQNLDKEIKLQDSIDMRPNRDNIKLNLQLDNPEVRKSSCEDQFDNDLSHHIKMIEGKDNPFVPSLDKSKSNELPSPPIMSCISKSILGTTNAKCQMIQERDYSICTQHGMAEEDTTHSYYNNKSKTGVESEKTLKEESLSLIDYDQANTKVFGSCVAGNPVKDLSEHDIDREFNNNKESNIKERTMSIDSASGKLSIEEPNIYNECISATVYTSDLNRIAVPEEHNSLQFSQQLNNSKCISPPEKYEKAAHVQTMVKICLPSHDAHIENEIIKRQTTLTNAEIHASPELHNQTPKQSDRLNTDFTPENHSKSNQSSRIYQSVSTDEHVTSSNTLRQLEQVRKLKPVENITFSDHLMDKSDQKEISKNNTQYSQSTLSSKSMINSQNVDKSKSEVHENGCSQQNTPEAALRRSKRESKHPIRFSSPEQNNMANADKQGCPELNKMPILKPTYKTRGKKQKIPISFAQTKTERKVKTKDMDLRDDFEVHQEKLNTYIQMEINYGQLLDDLKRNLPARESFKRCVFQFKTLQPQLMKLLSDSKEESLRISSKACAGGDKSIIKTRIKLLSIRQKKLKALFDRHCTAQLTLKLMKSKMGDEDITNFTHMEFGQSTTSMETSKHYIPNLQTTHKSTEKQTDKRTEFVLNDVTGLFEAVGQKPEISQGSTPEAMTQKVSNVPIQAKSLSLSSNHDGPSQQTTVSVPRSMDSASTVSGKNYVQTNPSDTHRHLSQNIVYNPVVKSLVGQNQNISSAPLYFKETNEARKYSGKSITEKFVPPTKQIFAKVDNNGSTVDSATSHIKSMMSISINNVHNKPSLPIIVPKSDRSSGAPQGTSHQVTKSFHDDEILDIILKSLDKDANESNGLVLNDSSYTDPHKLSSLHQEDSDGFEFEDEIVDVTREKEIGSNICEKKFPATVPNQQSNVQPSSANLLQNLLVKPSALDMNGLCRPTIKPSEAVNILPTKAPDTKSPFQSPCRSVMSFKSNFSTSSTRYLRKMKEKALKITQAKTARDFQAAIGNAPDTKKYKKFPSLKKMMDKGLLKPGKNKLSIIHKGQRLAATLLDSGTILDATGQRFSTATKWFSVVTGAQLTMKAKAYKMVFYENTPLMEFKKQYDKSDFNNPSSKTCLATDSREQSNKASSANLVSSSFLQTRDDAASVYTCPTSARSNIGKSTFTATPQYKTAFQSNTNATTMPVRYQIMLPRGSNPQYPHQLPNQVRYSIRTRCTTPVSIPTNLIRVTNNVAPMNRSAIGNQHILHPRKQLIATATDNDVSINPHISKQSYINEDIRSILMKSINVLLVSDSELVFYPDITEDFWTKPFKDVSISKELWKEVDGC